MGDRRRNFANELRAVPAAYAAVLFGGDARLGALLLGLTWLQPVAGAMGLCAVVAAHAVSWLLGYRADDRHAGAHGFNAALAGLFLAGGRAPDAALLLVAVAAGAATVIVTVVAEERLRSAAGLPVLVLPFVAVVWLLGPALGPLPAPLAAAAAPAALLPWPFDDVAHGFASIYCQPGELAGLLVFAALVVSTRHGALAAAVGVAAAMVAGAAVGVAPGTPLAIALVYNGALTGLALGGALLVPGRAAFAVAAAGAAVAALVTAGAAVLAWRLQLPVLSAPFALTTLLVLRALRLRPRIAPPFVPPLPAAGPEANFEYVQNMARRFGPPGVPEFVLPFRAPAHGAWIVSQGVDGEHTHRGPWAHAWDFEVVDERGFPFAGAGLRREDYFAFGAAVVAPGAGVVASVSDGCPDGEVGAVDAARPWGNAVVLRHGEGLYSVLAHLRCGSIRVRAGQSVAAGDELAACGASGRSPRPHLHFQVQARPELGAPSRPARCVHWLRLRAGEREFVAFGTPAEGERIAPASPAVAPGWIAALAPGAQLQFAIDGGGTLRLHSEISLFGERWLRDLDRGDRLFFVINAQELVFTAHDGPASAPLRGFLLALGRLCWPDAGSWCWRDAPPAEALLGWPARRLRRWIAPLVDPFRATAALRARRDGDRLAIESHCRLRGGPAVDGRARFDEHGLLDLELRAAGTAAVLLRLHRDPAAEALATLRPDRRPLEVHP